LTVQDLARILRTGWKTICGTTAVIVLLALAYVLLETPQYQAATRLFVSSTAGGSATETNDGNIFAQRQVLSYVALLKGDVVAQRTIDKLNLSMSAAELQQKVTATAPADTVLIDVAVLDASPARARDIANTLSDEFAVMAAGLSTPDLGARPAARVIVQQRAGLPVAPVSPKRTRNLAIAVVLGALLGVIAAIARDRFDDRIKTVAAIEKATGVGLVGDIPVDAQRRKQPAIAFESDQSRIAEAFRELRINVKFLEVGDGPRVLLVASAMPNEGRTTTALNLALALAQAGHKVVLVDGDLRRPRVASYLDIDQQVGLSTVLTGRSALGEALIATRFPRLTALGSGPVPDNPAELLESQAAKDVVRELGESFDYVIVDSPPTLVTDASILAANAQGVLLIARFGQTKRTQLNHAADVLGRAGAPLLGAVVTMTPAKKRRSIEQSYYGKGKSTQPQHGPERPGTPKSD
jgi:capsular exopolysaccharide synthesis family protein